MLWGGATCQSLLSSEKVEFKPLWGGIFCFFCSYLLTHGSVEPPWGGATWQSLLLPGKPSFEFQTPRGHPLRWRHLGDSCRENQASFLKNSKFPLLRCLTHKILIFIFSKNQNGMPWDGATWKVQIHCVWILKISKISTNTLAHAQLKGSPVWELNFRIPFSFFLGFLWIHAPLEPIVKVVVHFGSSKTAGEHKVSPYSNRFHHDLIRVVVWRKSSSEGWIELFS